AGPGRSARWLGMGPYGSCASVAGRCAPMRCGCPRSASCSCSGTICKISNEMRLFAAIDIDAAVRAKIAATQRGIADVGGEAAHDLRFLEPGQLPLTLVFSGEADADRARVVVDAMSADLPLPSFQMHLGEVGV